MQRLRVDFLFSMNLGKGKIPDWKTSVFILNPFALNTPQYFVAYW
jgi:hypothetical protein